MRDLAAGVDLLKDSSFSDWFVIEMIELAISALSNRSGEFDANESLKKANDCLLEARKFIKKND